MSQILLPSRPPNLILSCITGPCILFSVPRPQFQLRLRLRLRSARTPCRSSRLVTTRQWRAHPAFLSTLTCRQEIETWVEALGHYDNQEFEAALRVFDAIADTSKILFNCGVIHATIGEHERAVRTEQK